LDPSPHRPDVAVEFPLAPLVLGDAQLFQLPLNSLALGGPQPATDGFMAACRDVTINKLTVDPMRGCECSAQFVCQPTEGDRPSAGQFDECHVVY
jgi:hypothetical protein